MPAEQNAEIWPVLPSGGADLFANLRRWQLPVFLSPIFRVED
jgi:hypothetical protein